MKIILRWLGTTEISNLELTGNECSLVRRIAVTTRGFLRLEYSRLGLAAVLAQGRPASAFALIHP